MSEVQVIQKDGKPVFYVVPAEMWERVSGRVEDADDVAAFDRAVAADDGATIPGAVAFAIADGVHPLKAWREHRGMTQDALATASGISKPYISQIESGKRRGYTATFRTLANALQAPWDTLVAEEIVVEPESRPKRPQRRTKATR